MGKKLISVIVPVYRVRKYLRRCVDSILCQTYQNLEVILVDDGTDDGCDVICDEYSLKDSRIRVVHKENGGLSDARNAGLGIAKGDYIGFVDSDDYIEPEMYGHLSYLMEDDVDVAVCNTQHEWGYKYKGNAEKVKQPCSPQKMKGEDAIRELLLLRKIDFSACNKLFRREMFEDICFPFRRSSEDVPVIWEIIKKSRFVVNVGYADHHYFHRPDSITQGDFSLGRLDGICFTREILEDVRKNHSGLVEEASLLNARFLLELMSQILRCGNGADFQDTFIALQEELKRYEDLIRNTTYLDDELKKVMIQAVHDRYEEQKERQIMQKEDGKLLTYYHLLLQWVENKNENRSIADRLRGDGIRTVAIYGMKELGELLYLELTKSSIEVAYIIDRRKEELSYPIPCFSPEDEFPAADAIIVTATAYYEEIHRNLLEHTSSEIYNLSDLIFAHG